MSRSNVAERCIVLYKGASIVKADKFEKISFFFIFFIKIVWIYFPLKLSKPLVLKSITIFVFHITSRKVVKIVQVCIKYKTKKNSSSLF